MKYTLNLKGSFKLANFETKLRAFFSQQQQWPFTLVTLGNEAQIGLQGTLTEVEG
jgi:hypothetical protein